jgi:hypothetical protein
MDDASPAMQLLRAHVPLTLLLDLAWAPSAATLRSREQADLAAGAVVPQQVVPQQGVRQPAHA